MPKEAHVTGPTPNAMPGAQQAAGGQQQPPPAVAGQQQPPPAGAPAGQPPAAPAAAQQTGAQTPPAAAAAPWEAAGEPFDPSRAWNTIQQQRAENAALKTRMQEAQPILDEHERLRVASQSELDTAREQLGSTASERDTWRSQAVQARAEALATGRFADAGVALQLLGDLSSYATDAGIDTARLSASLDELANKHPFLLLQPNAHGLQPDRAQGQSGAGGAAAATLDAQIKDAEARGDIMASIALKQQKLHASTTK